MKEWIIKKLGGYTKLEIRELRHWVEYFRKKSEYYHRKSESRSSPKRK